MTKIEWTDRTWNPIVGCTKISSGCKNCYAERMAARLATIEQTKYKYLPVVENGKWNGKTYFDESIINKPYEWIQPRKVFVCSMGDLFHEYIPLEWIEQVWSVICDTPNHTYQILTKRADRMLQFTNWTYVPDNVWLGVTVEDQKNTERIDSLIKIQSKVKFISAEPLLEEIKINPFEFGYGGINWVVAGQETGTGKRPFKREWLESLYLQCKEFNVPFFDKKDILGINMKKFPNV